MNSNDKRTLWRVINDARVQEEAVFLKNRYFNKNKNLNNHIFHSLACEYIDYKYYVLDDFLPPRSYIAKREFGVYIFRSYIEAFLNEFNRKSEFWEWLEEEERRKIHFWEAINSDNNQP